MLQMHSQIYNPPALIEPYGVNLINVDKVVPTLRGSLMKSVHQRLLCKIRQGKRAFAAVINLRHADHLNQFMTIRFWAFFTIPGLTDNPHFQQGPQ